MKDSFRIKSIYFVIIVTVITLLSSHYLSFLQAMSLSIFSASVLGTILFWEFRLAVAFIGIGFLIITKTLDIEQLVYFASLEVILFLVAMMIIMGLLKEVNLFGWLLSKILLIKNLTARKLFIIVAITSAILACLIDEVTSIIFMIAFIIEVSDILEIKPTPLIITSVMATNVGSSGTVLGNPIGILIATKAGLTFEDFLIWAFPITCIATTVTVILVLIYYRKEIPIIDAKLKTLCSDSTVLCRTLAVPMTKDIIKELTIFIITLIFIALHHRLEEMFGLPTNGLLLAIPLISAGGIMAWRRESARSYVEKDVDWWTLIFYMLLFAKAGTLKFTGVTDIMAHQFSMAAGSGSFALISLITWVSFFGSAVMDNVVLVSVFIPVIHSLKELGIHTFPLWWALLFGGCVGGNLTIIGSTANIVAIGLLDKKGGLTISFYEWFKVGLFVSLLTMVIVWILLLLLSGFMP